MPTAELGLNLMPGSSMSKGYAYQNIPSRPDIPFHRGESDWRARRIMELADVTGKTVYDLGCSVGTISGILSQKAKRVVGIDYDLASIELARSLYPNVEFILSDIDSNFLKGMESHSICIWTSQFMWMVKQKGIEAALDFVWDLSKKCDVLIFETATRDDGQAPLDISQDDIFSLLIKNTVYQDIVDHGPWNDGWTPRNVFVCQKPFVEHRGDWSSIRMEKRGEVIKEFKDQYFSRELKKREAECLQREELSGFVPAFISDNECAIKMSYEGFPAKWLPSLDINIILAGLDVSKIKHRDIRPSNLLWNGNRVVLIDFSFATIGDEITNYHYDLGGAYKCPYGFNDEYSLKKVQAELSRA